MIACYDLARNPPTYDVVAFLALAEAERARRGDDSLAIMLCPGPNGGFRRDSVWPQSVEVRSRLLMDVVVPLIRMLPSASGIEIRSSRDEVPACAWGVNTYSVGLPKIVEALRAGSRPLRATDPRRMTYLKDYVTITLREAEHHPLRNSCVHEWLAASFEIEEMGYPVIFVRDTARYDQNLGARVCPAASLRVADRAALYAGAAMNMGISNGPMWMSIFMSAPTLMLRPTTNAAGGCYDDAFFARWGLRRGEQLPTSPPHQRLVWEDDTRESIVRAFREMMGHG